MPALQTGATVIIDEATETGSQSVNVPADATLMVVLGVSNPNGVPYFSTGVCSIGGQNLTCGRADDTDGAYYASAIMHRNNPPTGSQTFAWDWGQTAIYGGNVLYIMFFKGTHPTSPIRSSGGQMQSDGDATTGSMAAQAGDLAVAVVISDSSFTINWTNAAEQERHAYNGVQAAYATASPTGDITITASYTQSYINISAYVIAGAPAAPPTAGLPVDVFLYAGEVTPTTIILSDPTLTREQGITAACAWGAPASWGAAADVAVSVAVAWGLPHGEAIVGSVSITGTQAWTAPSAWSQQASVSVTAGMAWSAPPAWASQTSVVVGAAAVWGVGGAWSSQASVSLGAAMAWGVAGAWSGQASLSVTAASAWERPGSWSAASSVALSAAMAWERSGSWAGAGGVAITSGSAWERPASWDAAGSVAITATAAWSAPGSWSATSTVGGELGPIEATCQWGAPASWAAAVDVRVEAAAAFGVPSDWNAGASVAIEAAQEWVAAFGWSAATAVDVEATLDWSAPAAWTALITWLVPGTVAVSLAARATVATELAGHGFAACSLGRGNVQAEHRQTWLAVVELTAATVEVKNA